MPSSVVRVFEKSGLSVKDSLPWGSTQTKVVGGVYVVSSAQDPAAMVPDDSAIGELDHGALAGLIRRRPAAKIDDSPLTVERLTARLRELWLKDEVILYIGRSGREISRRLQEYHRTPLGEPKPHRGGCWIHALARLDRLWVHVAPAEDPEAAEKRTLRAFEDSVSPEERDRLNSLGRGSCLSPWANLRGSDGRLKRHGVTGACG